MDLSIIVVSYNTKEYLAQCVESIFSNVKKLSYEVIVVDNNSHDKSAQYIEDKFPNVRVIKNKENLGFSKANNVGVKVAKGRYILFLNPDTLVPENTLEEMVKFMDQNLDAGAATSRVVLPNGINDDSSHRGFPTPWNSIAYFSGLSRLFPKSKIFNGYNMGYLPMDRVHEIDALAGSFMIVRRLAGEDVNWWDEDFFFYGEDLDFCYELKEKGWKIYYVPSVKITHLKGVSGGIKKVSKEITTATDETRNRAKKERFNAMRIFYSKHYVNKYPKILTWTVLRGIDLKERFS